MFRKDEGGVMIRSRFKQNQEEERGSLFHAARELKNSKNNLNSLKIGGMIEKDKAKIEEEVLNYFGALFNGRHNKELIDSGVSFVPDYTQLSEILTGVGKLTNQQKEELTRVYKR
jgi:hypothetical protein